MKKIVIIGGVAGGATAAARLRRISEDFEIVIFEKDEYVAFANCGLPYYIGDQITQRDNLFVQTVEGLTERYNLDIRNFSLVTNINRDEKTVSVKNLSNDETYDETYDYLILSPGAYPIKPNFPGLEAANNAFTLRNIENTDHIKDYLNNNQVRKAVVCGGGFIGVEMAENLCELGIEVTLIDLADQILKPFDPEIVSELELKLKAKGIKLVLGKKITDITNNAVVCEEETYETDLTILAIGVRPASELAKNAGLDTDKQGYILVDDYLKTNDDSIYAIGDAIKVKHFIDEQSVSIPLAWPANRQGRIVADTISGFKKTKYQGTVGASILKVFELTAASVGYTQTDLERRGVECASAIVAPNSNAGYYPGAKQMTLKLIFNPKTGEIYGAQGVGEKGVDKRIDVISTAIQAKMTVEDLPNIELCYAPPYNSAKDPVNQLGYHAENILSSESPVCYYNQLDAFLVDENTMVIDVRTELEVSVSAVEGAFNIPLETLRTTDRLPENLNQEIVVFCRVGQRGYIAQQILKNMGYTNVKNLDGGLHVYDSFKKNQIEQENIKIEQNGVKMKCVDDNCSLEVKTLDARGLQCPGPIMKTDETMKDMQNGEQLLVKATDGGFCADIQAWCNAKNNQVISQNVTPENDYEVLIQKGSGEVVSNNNQVATEDKGTIVLFSGELDKALAAMIIAQGGQAMGKQMTIFATFWGLNALRKDGKVDVDKTNFEKMFGAMMPKGADKLGLSNMNMGGVGSAMIKKRMADKNVDDLPTMIKKAQDCGVKIIACAMSMDLMGIKEEELIDGIEIGGVAKYIGESTGADMTLFI